MPIDPDTGRYWTPKYRSKFEAVRTIASCVSAVGSLAVLIKLFFFSG